MNSKLCSSLWCVSWCLVICLVSKCFFFIICQYFTKALLISRSFDREVGSPFKARLSLYIWQLVPQLLRYRFEIFSSSFCPRESAHFSEPSISNHYSLYLSYKLVDQNLVHVWKTFVFNEISSRNLRWIIA